MTDEAAVQDGEAETPQPTPEIEDKARRMGWRPQEEFKGDATRWVDAETFVRRGEEVLPIVQAANRQLERALEKATGKIAEMEQTFREFGEHHTRTVKSQYERAMRDLEERQAYAAEAGDVEGVKALTREITDLTAQMSEPKAEDKKPKPDPKLEQAITAFKADNPWFETDAAMTGAAVAIADQLVKEGVLDTDAQLAEVAKRIRAEFPHKFENPRRSAAAAVEGASGQKRSAQKTYSDLPAEAKAACDRFVKQGLLTRDQFVKDYQWA